MGRVRDFSLGALIVSCFLQVGAQLFAIVVVARTVSAAPPRSLRILGGEYGYDSSAFWQTVPTMTLGLFLVALVTNWKSTRRGPLLAALALFVVGGTVAQFFLEPEFAELIRIGYRDTIDPALQSRAATWYRFDCVVWLVGLAAGVVLLLAFRRSDPPTMVADRPHGTA